MPRKLLKDIINSQLIEKGVTPDQLAESTGMPINYLDAILNDKPKALPPIPYIRAHLVKLAEQIGHEPADILASYRADFIDKISGPSDRLPDNRFAIGSNKRKPFIIVGIIVLVILGIFILRQTGVFGKPYLSLINPPPGDEVFVVNASEIDLKGRVNPGDTISINGQALPISDEGVFEKSYPLSPELNSLDFLVKRFLGKEIHVLKQVYYNVGNENKNKTTN